MPLAPPALPPAVDDPPAEVEAMLARLANALDRADGVPARRPDNLLIGTWNIRAFGGLTGKWRAGAKDSPLRNLADVCAIAEIVSRFDVVAVQETRDNLTALRTMMARLGEHWAFIVTDVGIGRKANGERLAYVYDRGRVTASGLAGELVVPAEGLEGHGRTVLKRQFARSPYAVSFGVGSQAFTLVTLHVLYGDDASERTGELGAIGRWLAERAKSGTDFNHNMIALGDFNIDRKDDALYRAFTSTGLRPPAGAGRGAPHDLPGRRRRALLRPDRLVHRRGRGAAADAHLHRPGGWLRLRPPSAGRRRPPGSVLADLRPLSAVGGVRTPQDGGRVRRRGPWTHRCWWSGPGRPVSPPRPA